MLERVVKTVYNQHLLPTGRSAHKQCLYQVELVSTTHTANGPHGRVVLLAPPALVNVLGTAALVAAEPHALQGRVTKEDQLQGLWRLWRA